MYFKLNPECYFIKGTHGSAIFDLINCEIYGLSIEESKILEMCENDNEINKNTEFLDELQNNCLGTYYQELPYIQKVRVGSPLMRNEIGNPPELYRAFLEITNECNLVCDFCGINGITRTKGCIGCNRWNGNSKSLKTSRWKEIIIELADLGCNEVFIKGGDLTLNWKQTIEIVDLANKKMQNVSVTIHSTKLNEKFIRDLKNKANIIVQINDYNQINELERNYSENFIYLITLSPEHWFEIANYGSNLIIDYTGINEKTFEKIPFINRKDVSSVNIFQFLNNMIFHPCLGHTLAISYNGNVLPCPMMRNHVFGNIKTFSLANIFQKTNKIQEIWELRLEKIEKCGECEFKYLCDDCRALEESLSGHLKGKCLCNYMK